MSESEELSQNNPTQQGARTDAANMAQTRRRRRESVKKTTAPLCMHLADYFSGLRVIETWYTNQPISVAGAIVVLNITALICGVTCIFQLCLYHYCSPPEPPPRAAAVYV